jgi:cobalt-zinc-cadmium efflux system membrane fusion protein
MPELNQPVGLVFKFFQMLSLLVVVGGVLLIFLVFVLGVQLPIPGLNGTASAAEESQPLPKLGVKLVQGQAHTLEIPTEVRTTLGIRKGGKDQLEVARVPTETRPLTMYGSTALDPTRLMRVRARFAPCEVVQIGQTRDSELSTRTGRSQFRELRPGDRVKKGDVLGIFFSVDVGSKKNDLLDALVQLELDQKILDRAEKQSYALPEVFLLNAQRAVQGDRNAINRALNNLKVWNIPQDEIDALHEEAKKISADKNAWYRTPEGRWVLGEKGKNNPDKEAENPWGRVTLRAPFDGVIVERNVVQNEMVVDNTVNLFQIAQVERLLVIANAPEDELPTLNDLKNRHEPLRWKVKTVGPKASTELEGTVEEIGYLIDPNQHTAVIKGYIDNPGRAIRAGQFISATVRVPPPEDVVEIPVDALVEDGQYSVVFVQPDPAKPYFSMRRVQPTHRFEKTIFVRRTPFLFRFTGTTTKDSAVVTNLSSTSGLAVGQLVTGPGIPANTTITGVTEKAITLSHPATASSNGEGAALVADESITLEEKDLRLLAREPLRPGERVLQTAVGELKAALLDLESNPAKDQGETRAEVREK